MTAVGRILDANANRAREAIRVLEDAARFALDDAALADHAKQLRDRLRLLLEQAGPAATPAWRDTPGDVGTALTAPGETRRQGVLGVVHAAGARLGEALRALEEYSKTLPEPGPIAAGFQAIRYDGYELHRRLVASLATGQARQWTLCALLGATPPDQRFDPDAILRLVDAVADRDAAADCVQLRVKDPADRALDAGPLLQLTRQAVAICRPRGVAVVVNDRPDVALAAGADGVHLGPGDLPVREARRIVGAQLLIGASAASLPDARAARDDGADYCGVGPMFPSVTKAKPLRGGPDWLREYLAWNPLPHLAIGGITPATLPTLLAAGARGVAVAASITAAPDPAAAARAIRAALDDALQASPPPHPA